MVVSSLKQGIKMAICNRNPFSSEGLGSINSSYRFDQKAYASRPAGFKPESAGRRARGWKPNSRPEANLSG